MNKEEKAEKKKQRGELKEETYNKYTDITNMLLEKGFYTGFHQTFTTFLAMSMCAEATKNNLMKIGADSKDIEQAYFNQCWLCGMPLVSCHGRREF